MSSKRSDIKKVLIIGSGPIVIGQACEFDYSGTQACKALRAEGLEVILVNSNPATIMTDPEIADRIYVEPLTPEFVSRIIEKEKPDSLIPTLGGQTALNLALALHDQGVLQRHNVRLLGTSPEVIRKAEDRGIFKNLLETVGAKAPKSYLVRTFDEGVEKSEELGLPIILRPNYTLGGGGGGIAYSLENFKNMLQLALQESPTSEVLIEQSILGWKEFELEVMRDADGTFVVVCSIENFDPCGVHTGDSITVAPQQTLSDSEYQDMRDEARKIVAAVGIETGGANIQFAVHPTSGERVVIEMNPRVSRSSALASKATGFPIAKIAALLAIGYRLNEITNDITQTTPCCYEPALDYVVTKIPRFAFEKFHGSKDLLTTQMKSVGEVMGIGRTFKESLQKAVHSLESSSPGLNEVTFSEEKIAYPNSQRLFMLAQAFREGYSVERLYELTMIQPWFLEQLRELVDFENDFKKTPKLDRESILRAKRLGFADKTLVRWLKNSTLKTERDLREWRWSQGIRPRFFQVDTCAGEFNSSTPYFYSSYWSQALEPQALNSKRVVIVGSGANRIGQGVEFDYGCVRGVLAFQNLGWEAVMINSNPETVSTDYDCADQLYFEPLTEEYVIEVMKNVSPGGFVTQWGGQTALNLTAPLVDSGYNLLGSSLKTIDLAEDRGQFAAICRELNVSMPKAATAGTLSDAVMAGRNIGYPMMCRPSYVLGGRRMEVLENEEDLKSYFERHGAFISRETPVLLDEFLEGALEVDVDLVRSQKWSVIGGVVEHIEAAGVHSGDSMGVLPPQRLRADSRKEIEELSLRLADRLGVVGHLNLQLALKNHKVFMLEANPRSSRSVPFVAKATHIPLVDLAVRAILEKDLERSYDWHQMKNVAVKGVVFPFKKIAEADSILGPEMKSTGETMGRGEDYAEALMKAFISCSLAVPEKGEIFMSLRDKDKDSFTSIAKQIVQMGFSISATSGTADFLKKNGVPCFVVRKVREGRPHCVDRIRSGAIALVINTTSGRRAIEDSFSIRRSCIDYSIPCITETDTAQAMTLAMQKSRKHDAGVSPLV